MKKKKRKLWLDFDRALSHDLGKQVLILLGILLVIFGISHLLLYISGEGWRTNYKDDSINAFLFPLYLLIDGNTFHEFRTEMGAKGWTLLFGILIYVAGVIVFTGMIIASITNMIARRVERHRDGLIHYLKSGHYIIMGYDDMVPSIISEIFFKNPAADVLLLTAVDAKIIRERLFRSVARRQMEQIFINYGQRTAKEYYKDICLEEAAEIFIVGKRSLSAHDAVNVECVESVCAYLKEENYSQKPRRITCVFEDLDTYAAFKTTEIFKEVRDLGMEFIPYNFYAGWAKQVFVRGSYKEKSNPNEEIRYPSLYGNGIGPEDGKYVHLVFIGTSNFAVSFAMEAAHLLHFPNFEHNNALRTRITFIELNAEDEMKQFLIRNRHFFEVQPYHYRDLTKAQDDGEIQKTLPSDGISRYGFLDVDFEFINGDAFSQEVQGELRKWAADKGQYLSIFMAMANQRNNFVMGMNMPDEVYDNAVPVFIRQDRADNFVTKLRSEDNKEFAYAHVDGDKLVSEKRKGRYANIYPFGMDDMAYCGDERSLRRAKLINYLYDKANYTTYSFPDPEALRAIPADEIWAEAETAWRKLSVALKWSSLYCAYNIPCKLSSLRAMRGLAAEETSRDTEPLNDQEIQELAAAEHNRWNVEKLLMGYRRVRPDEDKYEHPGFAKELAANKKLYRHHDIRPFSELDNVRQMDLGIVKLLPWVVEMGN